MISTIGRIPAIAAPMPAPTMAISEIGVLRTRSGPNSSSIPCVTPIEPPISAMSSPMMKTSSSRLIAVDIASLTASLYESSGILALLTPRWRCGAGGDSARARPRRATCRQRSERGAEAGSARLQRLAVRGVRH
jgi:hypothetical protein